MASYGVADSADLEILAKAVDQHCSKHGLVSADDREMVALKAFSLFSQGVADIEELAIRLEQSGPR